MRAHYEAVKKRLRAELPTQRRADIEAAFERTMTNGDDVRRDPDELAAMTGLRAVNPPPEQAMQAGSNLPIPP